MRERCLFAAARKAPSPLPRPPPLGGGVVGHSGYGRGGRPEKLLVIAPVETEPRHVDGLPCLLVVRPPPVRPRHHVVGDGDVGKYCSTVTVAANEAHEHVCPVSR